MRPCLAVLATVVTTLLGAVVPSVVSAAPRHDAGLTINAIPNPIDAGEGVFIYGHLNVAPVGWSDNRAVPPSGRVRARIYASRPDDD